MVKTEFCIIYLHIRITAFCIIYLHIRIIASSIIYLPIDIGRCICRYMIQNAVIRKGRYMILDAVYVDI